MEIKFKMRLYDEEKHYGLLKAFMSGHGVPFTHIPPKELVPYLGVACCLDDEIAGFSFYYRDSIKPIALKAFQTTNPTLSARDAIKALDAMDDYIEFSLERQGVAILMTLTGNKTISKRAKKQGNTPISTNETLLIKELWERH